MPTDGTVTPNSDAPDADAAPVTDARVARALAVDPRACWEWMMATDRVWLSPAAQRFYPGLTAWRTLEGLLTPFAAVERHSVRTACIVQATLGPSAPPFRCVMQRQVAGMDSQWIEWRGAAHDDPDTGGRVVSGTWTDVTSTVRACDVRHVWRTRIREGHLRDAKEAAEEAVRAHGAALAHLAHEVRTPLNAILGLTDLVLDALLDVPEMARPRVFLQRSQDSARHLLTLVDQGLCVQRPGVPPRAATNPQTAASSATP